MQPEPISLVQRESSELRNLLTRAEEMLAKIELLVARNEAMQRELARAIESLSTLEKSRRDVRPTRVEAAIS
jgi:hypothetical protein